MRDRFAKRTSRGRAGLVKEWVARRLELTEDDLVTVAELACHEPNCPPVETVLAVHKADGTRRDWRIHKPLAEVNEADVEKVPG